MTEPTTGVTEMAPVPGEGKAGACAARDWLDAYHLQERFGEASFGLGRETVWPSFSSGTTWKWQQADVLWETSVKSQGVRLGFSSWKTDPEKG